jgi:hypothetical protein
VGFYEHRNSPSGSIKCGELLDREDLLVCQVLFCTELYQDGVTVSEHRLSLAEPSSEADGQKVSQLPKVACRF